MKDYPNLKITQKEIISETANNIFIIFGTLRLTKMENGGVKTPTFVT